MDHLTEQDAGLLEQAASMLESLANDERNRGNCSSSEGASCSAHAIRRLAPALLRAGSGCLAQIEEPAQPAPIVLDDRWKARILDGRAIERDEMGLGDHPELPQLDEGMKPRGFFAALGLELTHTMAEDQLDGDALEAMGDAVNWTAWQPTPPQGDGWKLVAIFDTEDGPAAWWLRELAEAEDGTTTIRNLQAEIEKLKARMARASRAGAAPAAVAGPADMRNALRWTAGGLRAVADDNDTLRIGSETRTVGEVLDAANAALEPAAPALEAPAAPVSTAEACAALAINSALHRIREGNAAGAIEPLEQARAALAAAPQAPAAPTWDQLREMAVKHGAWVSGYGPFATELLATYGRAPEDQPHWVAQWMNAVRAMRAAPAAPVYPAKFGPDDWIMVVAGIPVKRDEWSPGAVKARTIYGTSAVSAVDASDTALLDAMERHRIALVPEFEGPWDAELYEEGEEPQHIGSGATPREALRAALVTHLQGSGAAISTVRENSAWPMPIPAAQAKKGGA